MTGDVATKVNKRPSASSRNLRGDDEAKNADAQSGDLTTFLFLASVAHVRGTLRLWRRWLEVFSKYSPEIVHTLRMMNSNPDQRGLAQRALIDDVAGCFRELAELRDAEARRFQTELEKLAATARPQSQPQDGPYRRRWHVKS